MNNRTIKFRVFDTISKQMHLVKSINYADDGFAETITVHPAFPMGDIRHGIYNGLVNGENGQLMQFTGLKDKNDKDIYEGDILRIPYTEPESTQSHDLVLVEYKYGAFGYKNCPSLRGGRFDILYSLIGETETDDCAEIVGNMYENPELCEDINLNPPINQWNSSI